MDRYEGETERRNSDMRSVGMLFYYLALPHLSSPAVPAHIVGADLLTGGEGGGVRSIWAGGGTSVTPHMRAQRHRGLQ